MSMQPGWYPDPFSSGGYVRWWDGQRWGPSTAAPPSEAGTTTDPGTPLPLPPPMAPSSASPWPTPSPETDPGAPVDTEGRPVALATWGSRAIARIIDWLLIGLLTVPFVLLLVRDAFASLWDKVSALPEGTTQVPPAITQQFTDDVMSHVGAITLLGVVIAFLYTVPQDAIWNRTVGKRLLGIRIRPQDADRRLGWPRATVRWLVWTGFELLAGGIFLVLDVLWPLWDQPWRQALHDKAAVTVVVRAR